MGPRTHLRLVRKSRYNTGLHTNILNYRKYEFTIESDTKFNNVKNIFVSDNKVVPILILPDIGKSVKPLAVC